MNPYDNEQVRQQLYKIYGEPKNISYETYKGELDIMVEKLYSDELKAKEIREEYKRNHKCCPKCGSSKAKITLMAFPLDINSPEAYEDRNTAVCVDCGDKHLVHNRIHEWVAIEIKEDIENKRILDKIKELVTPEEYGDILSILEDSGHTFHFKITDKPKGKYQKEDLDHIKGLWVNQTTNGGYMGDEFRGTISIKLPNEKYFQFNYSM